MSYLLVILDIVDVVSEDQMDLSLVMSIIGTLSVVVTTIFTAMSGVIWYFITKDAHRVEVAINNLSQTVSMATLTLKGIEIELRGLQDYVHTENKQQWDEINSVKLTVSKMNKGVN